MDRVRPGDTVRILPGIYHERIHLRRGGNITNPVVIEAEEPGSVTVSWACDLRDVVLSPWSDLADGIFVTRVKDPIYWLTVGEQSLFRVPWGGLPELRRLTAKPHAFAAFWYESGRLYIYLPRGQRPEDTTLTTHRPVPEPREWGEFKSANCWVEANHIVLRNLRFEFGVGAAILLWSGEHVLVEDCAFERTTFGVKAGLGAKPTAHLTVWRCLYHNYPQYEWHRAWLDWNEIYASYPSSSLISALDEHTTVEDSVVTQFGDGLRLTTRDALFDYENQVVGNWIAFGTDDAIEFDGPARDVEFSANMVIDCHESLGLSPATSGPVVVTGNLFLHPHVELNGAQIKLLGNDDQQQQEIRNINIERNVFYGNWLCWWHETPVHDVIVRDNVFHTRHQTKPPWPPGVTDKDNQYHDLKVSTQLPQPLPDVLASIRAKTGDQKTRHLVDQSERLADRRPGPRWWKLNDHPATRPLAALRSGNAEP